MEVQYTDLNQFFEEVLNNMPADIAVFSPDGKFIYINPNSVANDELRQWLIGKTTEDYCRLRNKPMELSAIRKKNIDEAIRTRKLVKWEEMFPMPDGQVKYQLRHLQPVMDEKNNIKFLVGYSIEMTEYREYEKRIHQSEKKYRDLFNYSQAWICTHDLNGFILSVNPSTYEGLEYTEAEMTGRHLTDFLPVEDRPKFNEYYLQPILQESRSGGVFRVLTKSGRLINLMYQNYRMEVPGTDSYVIGFSQDITERIEKERELRLAKQLSEEAARAKEVFLANMSHEIRTPMTGVLGIAGLLGKTNLDEQQRNYLKLIQASANNLLQIVNDVLDLEKIIVGKLQFEHVVFSLADRVEMCIQSFTFKAEEKGIGLSYKNLLPDEIVVLGDPFRLSQVLNNLISNAIKFTETGVVIIETKEVERKDDAVWVSFTVEDTGVGISDDKLEIIFEPFMQANSSVSRTHGGTGLGLSICRELINMMGGSLQVHSTKDKGSVFSFILPFAISLSKPNDPTMTQEINYKSLGRRHVLVAEDVELNQFLARHIMESWGFVVEIANNGREAVNMVENNSYDLILMDIQMPEMDGLQATKHIRKLQNLQKATIPIIALTANALKGDSEKYIAAGMNDYLSKPFAEDKLFKVISRNLGAGVQVNAGTVPDHIDKTDILEEKLYDLSMVQSIAGGDNNFILRMVKIFVDTIPQTATQMQQELNQQNWDAVGRLAHKMKSTLDSMGIVSLKEDIRTIEASGKKGENLDQLPALVERVTGVVEQVTLQLRNDFDVS